MDEKMIKLLDSAQTISMLALLIAQNANEKEKAEEIALSHIDSAMRELKWSRLALSEIIRMQELL